MIRACALLSVLAVGLACKTSRDTFVIMEKKEKQKPSNEQEEPQIEEPDEEDPAMDAGEADAGTVAVGCDFHMIGYGRTSPDALHSGEARVQAPTCITEVMGTSIQTQNLEATTCGGDRGAPLIRNSTSEIVGVQWGFSYGPQGQDCVPGPQNWVNFTSIPAYRDWIDAALAETPPL